MRQQQQRHVRASETAVLCVQILLASRCHPAAFKKPMAVAAAVNVAWQLSPALAAVAFAAIQQLKSLHTSLQTAKFI
jgi:hypothetical protein